METILVLLMISGLKHLFNLERKLSDIQALSSVGRTKANLNQKCSKSYFYNMLLREIIVFTKTNIDHYMQGVNK